MRDTLQYTKIGILRAALLSAKARGEISRDTYYEVAKITEMLISLDDVLHFIPERTELYDFYIIEEK